MTLRLSLLPLLLLATISAFAEGTRTWEQSKYDEFEKGTARGVAIRSDGTLELAPAFQSLATTPSTYIWAIASGPDGAVYVAAGSPARVYRVAPDGKSTVLLQPQELQVQALAVDAKGTVYAATSPDGRVYRIERDATQPSGWKSSTFYEPRTKYIWDLALDHQGRLYVATGDHGEIFRVDPDGVGLLLFKSDEAHIRRLAFDTKGDLIAGSDGSGLVYRISSRGEAFVLYSAAKKEITALALDSVGNIYAAGVGEKRSGGAAIPLAGVIPQPVIPSVAPAAAAPGGPIQAIPILQPALGPVGSEVYRIAIDGSTTRLWSSKEETVYALGFDSRGRLLVGTGNKGRVFSVQNAHESTDLLRASASQVTGFAPAANGGLYVSTSNLGKLFLLSRAPAAEGTYESDVFDAHNFSRWGRAEVRGNGSFELWARSGNVDNPDRNWSPWSRLDLTKGAELNVPPARFAQWKAVMRPGTPEPTIDSVIVNYLPKNTAPVIDEVNVQPGAHFGAGNLASGTRAEAPATVRDRNYVAVRWSAHDDNDDKLSYTLYYRGDRETRWKLLKSGVTDKYYSLDASLLPDGGYTIKVVVTDAPSHSPGEALTDERISQHFELDTTPPRIEGLSATARPNGLQVTFRAVDNFSAIKRAEYSVDAGEWTYVEPVGQISDKSTEEYQFSAPLPSTPTQATSGDPGEHVVVIRVWDRFDNMGTAKAVLPTR